MDDADHASKLEEQDRARAIDTALQRQDSARVVVDDDGQRLCIDCEADIPKARIAVQPTAKRCISCQQKYEGT
ncbi:MAG: TraR/DksA C4-type zinc finger protein [Magnetococcales bacterium]|nr:TraR/DksA C4-type zinc finger protein [Magnetococcales bacterium]